MTAFNTKFVEFVASKKFDLQEPVGIAGYETLGDLVEAIKKAGPRTKGMIWQEIEGMTKPQARKFLKSLAESGLHMTAHN
jgi:hypothetical protein